MLKHVMLGTAVLLTAAGAALAQRPPVGSPMRPPVNQPMRPTPSDRYTRLANEWVQLYLRRPATQRDVAVISNQLRLGASYASVQATILGSDEYYIRCNRNLNNWAQSVVRDVLGRNITLYELSLMQTNAMKLGRVAAAQVVLESVNTRPVPPWWWF